jgi:very-short-patch-repair endonuclease
MARPTEHALRLYRELKGRGLIAQLEYDQVPNIVHAFDIGFPDSRALVEVNGGCHLGWKQRDQDEMYAELARREGWKVITVWNEEIDADIVRVVSKILAAIARCRR